MAQASDYLIDFNKSLDNLNDVKIFFGDYDGIQRYDRYKYLKSEKLSKVQRAATWFPKEINFNRDRSGFHTVLKEATQTQYKLNLLYQTIADSLVNRFLDHILLEYITSPEWENVLKIQSGFELLHSEAYSWNIKEVFDDPEKFFNEGYKDKYLQSRLDIELQDYTKLNTELQNSKNLDDKKKFILKVLIRQFCLESIRFFVSFLYTLKINDLNDQVLQGSVNNIKLILNDEIIHVTIFKDIIKILMTEKSEGFKHLIDEDFYKMVVDSFKEVIQSEVQWFKYLNSFDEIQGFNTNSITEFLEYYANKSCNLINVENPFRIVKNELVTFFESKKNLNDIKSQAQETNLLTYNIAVLENYNYKKEDIKINIEELF